MKKIILTAAIALMSIVGADAQGYYGSSSYNCGSRSNSYGSTTNSSVHYQRGYTRTDGTYVQGHYKTNTNSTNHDNFSTRGNVNSYTGTSGSRARDYSTGVYNYGSGHTVHTGSRGGQYYINSNGNRTYVPKRR
jgi:hypothetical protein